MKVVTWNVNGIRAREAQVLDWIGREQPDVVCLQELKSPAAKVPEALCGLEGYWCHWHGETSYSGVGLHLRRDAFVGEPRYFHPPFDYENRIVVAELGNVRLASVYVPNGGKDYEAKIRFLTAMVEWAADLHADGGQLILCGDLNIARNDRDVHPKERKPGIIGQRPEERALFERLLAAGLVDVQRGLHPDADDMYTWWAPWRNMRQRNIGWRLDYVLASEPLAARAQACEVLREFGTSDHGPVVATFAAELEEPASNDLRG